MRVGHGEMSSLGVHSLIRLRGMANGEIQMRQMFLEELHEHAAPRFFKPDQATRGGGRVTMG